MTQRSSARRRKARDGVPRNDVGQKDQEERAPSRWTAWLESATQETLAVTYWFDPAPGPSPYPVTVRFSGHRVDVKKRRLHSRDRFVQDEKIEAVVPGSGPISVTARIRNINPGSWVVTAQMLSPAHPAQRRNGEQGKATPVVVGQSGSIARWWRKWAPDVSSVEAVSTCLLPFAHVPGILPGIWGVMVVFGMVIALVLQFLVISVAHLALGSWWVISLGAILVGIVGAKAWYIFLYRREHLVNGWCIQGFITGATLSAATLLMVLGMPIGTFLDATAPGLLLAMAIGRIGCFFAGCCGGPPTASRFGVWSSDQRVGARRVPTQLLESGLAGTLGLLTLVTILGHGPAGGAFFVGGLAVYTLVRQGILHLRAEPRKTRLAGPITATLAALVLIAAIVFSLIG